MFQINICFLCSFVVIPQIVYNNYQEVPSVDTASPAFHVADLITAQGFMADSIVFYGAYANQNLNLTARHFYNIPHAYFMTLSLLYVVTFVVVSINVAQSYRRSFIEAAGSMPNLYAHKLFSSWDFSISSHKAAQLKHSQIYFELKEVLADIQAKRVHSGRWQTIGVWIMHATAHVLVLCVLAGIGLAQWSLLQTIAESGVDKSTWGAMWVALMVNGTLGVMQVVFKYIAR